MNGKLFFGCFSCGNGKIGVDGKREVGENGDDVRDGSPIKTAGLNGRKTFISLCITQSCRSNGNLRNFHNRRHVLSGALQAHTPRVSVMGFSGPPWKTQGECAFLLPESILAG